MKMEKKYYNCVDLFHDNYTYQINRLLSDASSKIQAIEQLKILKNTFVIAINMSGNDSGPCRSNDGTESTNRNRSDKVFDSQSVAFLLVQVHVRTRHQPQQLFIRKGFNICSLKVPECFCGKNVIIGGQIHNFSAVKVFQEGDRVRRKFEIEALFFRHS